MFYYHDDNHPFAQLNIPANRRVKTDRDVSPSSKSQRSRDKSPKVYLQELVRVRRALRRESKRRAKSQNENLPVSISPKNKADGFSLTFRRNYPSPKASISVPSPPKQPLKILNHAKHIKVKSFTSVLNIQKLSDVSGIGLSNKSK